MHKRYKQPRVSDPVHILVVEDNLLNQMVARSILESVGYTVAMVNDGRAAISALESRHFDLVLMDCSMPVMDGFSATRSIRANRSGSIDQNVPIVAFTAFALEGDKKKCLQAGMDDFVSKPVEPSKLIATIERWLGRCSGRNPSGQCVQVAQMQ